MDCTEISIDCRVEDSIYGYYPNLAANAFFSAFFGLFLFINLFFGIRHRTWTFLVAMALGCLTECLGYIGRILLHPNPFSNAGFEIQICCLTLAPAFVSAGIYLTLKHVVICFGEEHSYLKPKYYTWLFILCDLFALILQGTGGGIAATSDHHKSLQLVGNDLMMAGICLQVVTLLVFGAAAIVYYTRLSRSNTPISAAAEAVRNSTRFKLFLGGFVLAFLTIFIRCVYRVAEMARGWANPIMRDERLFIILDSVMVMAAVLAMTIFHPGYCFPQMAWQARTKQQLDIEQKVVGNNSEEEVLS